MSERIAAAANVIDALRNEGRAPIYHRRQVEHLRREWPTLYYALLQLEAATDVTEKETQ